MDTVIENIKNTNTIKAKNSLLNGKMKKNYIVKSLRFFIVLIFCFIVHSISFSVENPCLLVDSLSMDYKDTILNSEQGINFKTFRIITNLNDESEIVKEQLFNFQNELGIEKGKELMFLEIYIDKTPDDMGKWNVLINDTSLQYSPSLPWVNLTDESRLLLDNWTGRNNRTILTPDNIDSIAIKKNEMFRVMAVPLISMGAEAKLSILQKDYSYEIIIVDDYPEQIEIENRPGLIIKRVDNNRFRIKLSKFNRAEFERWSENRADDPYVYTVPITLYDKLSNQRSIPVNLKYTFGEY